MKLSFHISILYFIASSILYSYLNNKIVSIVYILLANIIAYIIILKMHNIYQAQKKSIYLFLIAGYPLLKALGLAIAIQQGGLGYIKHSMLTYTGSAVVIAWCGIEYIRKKMNSREEIH